MNRTFFEEYYDLKYGTSVDYDKWLENCDEYQDAEKDREKLEDEFVKALRNTNPELVKMYEDLSYCFWKSTSKAMKEMYLRGIEDKENASK